MSFGGGLKKQISSRSKGTDHVQVPSNKASLREIDLRAEEILEAYWVIMRKTDPKMNIDTEHTIFNLLAKLSKLVATNKEMTWSKALEHHFNRNTFKAKSKHISQNFIFRKFFCRWLEQYLQVH